MTGEENIYYKAVSDNILENIRPLLKDISIDTYGLEIWANIKPYQFSIYWYTSNIVNDFSIYKLAEFMDAYNSTYNIINTLEYIKYHDRSEDYKTEFATYLNAIIMSHYIFFRKKYLVSKSVLGDYYNNLVLSYNDTSNIFHEPEPVGKIDVELFIID